MQRVQGRGRQVCHCSFECTPSLKPGLWQCRDMITCWIIKILRLPKNTVLTADHWRSWRQYVLDPKEELVRRLGLPAHEILGLCDFKIWDAYNRAAHEATPEEIASAVKNEILVHGDKVNHLYAILPKIA